MASKRVSAPAVPPSAHQAQQKFRVVEARGERVVLDADVARLFGVETRKLNQQVSRNKDRFGDDFAFKLTLEEVEHLRSQNVISNAEWGGLRYAPIVFTEHGVVMAATVLKSPQALTATRLIVRTFVDAKREAWEQELSKRLGGQLPLAFDVPTKQGLTTKLNSALGHVLDAIVDPREARTVRDEAREVAAQGIQALKDYISRVGINNEKSAGRGSAHDGGGREHRGRN